MRTELVVDCSTGEATEASLAMESLAEAQQRRWAEVKVRRDAAIDAGVTVAGIGIFDSDAISRGNINGAVTGALMAQAAAAPFSVSWKLADNSIVTLDAAQMLLVGAAALAHVAAAHARSQVLGAEILAAQSPQEVDAIDTESGWPQ
jgi:heterodisulfide reductase subunit A-like polyferredoxin